MYQERKNFCLFGLVVNESEFGLTRERLQKRGLLLSSECSWVCHREVLKKVRVFSAFREQAITPMEITAIGYSFFLPLKLGIEQLNKVSGKIKISYLLVEIFERPLNNPKRPWIENIGILYKYCPGVRGTNTQRLPSSIWEQSHLCQDFHDSYQKLIRNKPKFLEY